MSRQRPEKAPVTFHDVAACFSEEQWKLLHEWQQELYRNVMDEIHQTLISLGPRIAASVFSLRSKEKQDVYHMNHRNSERRHCISNPQRFPFLNSEFCLSKEGEASARLMGHFPAEGGERGTSHSSGFAFLDTNFCVKNEAEPSVSLIGHPGAEGRGSSTNPSSEHALMPEVVLVHIKEEEETYSMDHHDSTVIETIIIPTATVAAKKIILMRRKEEEPPTYTEWRTETVNCAQYMQENDQKQTTTN